MKKIVMFDLYDTVLKDVFLDFAAGLAWLHETYFAGVCTFDEIKEYSDSFLPRLKAREIDNSELHFINDQLVPMFHKFGVPVPEDLDELEYTFMNKIEKEALLDEVKETLQELFRREVPMYILSNSIFTGKSNSRMLQAFGILPYFTKVYSSADYGVRKPGKAFFDIAVEQILQNHPECNREDILFVGNSYNADVEGAVGAGLDAVWYNVSGQKDEKDICICNTAFFKEVLKYFN